MTMVWGDPAGFAVDWDWQRGLTVWVLAGRPFEPRFDRMVLAHELPARPASERRARAAARRWWQAQGRTEALGAAGPGHASSSPGGAIMTGEVVVPRQEDGDP